MAKKGISEFLTDSRGLTAATQNHLRQLVERYPFYHAARLLYLRFLFQNHDTSFHAELRKAALYVPSRIVLYNLIEGERLNPSRLSERRRIKLKNSSPDDDRTNSLIGQFLDSMPEKKRQHQHKVDASVDYLEYLRQNESYDDVISPQNTSEMPTAIGVIDEFLDNDGRLVLHDRKDEDLLKPLADEGNNEKGILTETMAKIYIKQQKYDQALEIIQKLSLKYPNKNRYFADQIRFLKKLIVNDRNK